MTLDWGPYGLAWAQSIVAMVEVIILFVIMSRQLPELFNVQFTHAIGRMFGATALMAILTYILVQIFQLQTVDQKFLETFPKFIVIVAVSLGSYVWFSQLLKLSEAKPVIKRVKSLLFGRAR
jgi:peptidoglycan biosynthesis protein MviN/MurJ (putative lipid II flippase)